MDPATPQQVVRFDSFEADFRSGELRKGGKRVRLQEQPFQALRLLLERAGEIVTRDQFRQTLWPAGTFVDFEDGLNTAIKKLREALDDPAETPRYIETVPRKGYRFLAAVQGGVTAGRPRRGAIFVAAALAGLLVSVFTVINVGGRGETAAPQIKALAVLPFENLTGDSTQEHLAHGITAGLMTELAQVKPLRVISMTSAMQYKSGNRKAPQIGRDLKVEALVEGSVRRSSDRLLIDVQLIHAATDRHLWARTYDRRLQDLPILQSVITQELIEELGIKDTGRAERLSAPRAVAPDVYESYLLGRFYFHKGARDPETTVRAKQAFEKAIAADPGFAPAYAALAELYARGGRGLVQQRKRSDWELRSQARQHAEKALQLDPHLSEAHAALAWTEMLDWDYTGAERAFRRALALNPNNAMAHVRYGEFLVAVHARAAGLEHVKLARQLDPASALINIRAGYAYFASGRTELARECYRRAQELDPSNTGLRLHMSQTHIVEGNYEKAIGELEPLVNAGDRSAFNLGTLARAHADAGNRDVAVKLLEELERRQPTENIPPPAIAYGYVGLQDFDQAMFWLETAYEERRSLYHIKTNPLLQPLRSDPRFQDLLRRIGMPDAKAN